MRLLRVQRRVTSLRTRRSVPGYVNPTFCSFRMATSCTQDMSAVSEVDRTNVDEAASSV